MRGRGEGGKQTVELTTPGICLALAFSEQLCAHGDVHGLLFGVCTNEKRTVVTDRDSREVTHTTIDVQVASRTPDTCMLASTLD